MKTSTAVEWLFFKRAFLHFALSILFAAADAAKINCTISRDAGDIIYSIPHVHASDCDYSWSENDTGEVLAVNKRMGHEYVKNHSIYTLVTSKCFPEISYVRICTSEYMEKMESLCKTDCPKTEVVTKDADLYWIVIPVLVIVFLLAAGLIYKFINCLKRTFIYTRVSKNLNNSPDTLD